MDEAVAAHGADGDTRTVTQLRYDIHRDALRLGLAMLAGWLVKFVVFLVAMLALRDQPWIVPGVLFAAVVTTVLASLVVDAVVVSRARIPVGTR